MRLFSGWLYSALSTVATVERASAPAIFLNRYTRGLSFAKWLGYVDQYVILAMILSFRSNWFDIVLFGDHGNAPSGLLVRRGGTAAMVHDTIAMRQARNELECAPYVGKLGRLLQRSIEKALAKSRFLYVNPGNIEKQLRALGISPPVIPLGCPLDRARLSSPLPSPFSGQRYILNVSGPGWRKRKESLFRVWDVIERTDGELHLVMVGNLDHKESALSSKYNFRRVFYISNVSADTLAGLYKECDALIVASLYEGLCLPIIEAASYGKPIFIPANADYKTIFRHEANTLDFEDPEAAADCLVKALRQPFTGQGIDLSWFSHEEFTLRAADGLLRMLDKKDGYRST